jgi:hypothetical protein
LPFNFNVKVEGVDDEFEKYFEPQNSITRAYVLYGVFKNFYLFD